jgi:glucosamine 6-phosphate synthetase-like amidotransferase/phosphosugar isomerase protein
MATVKQVLREAEAIERSAKESLEAWVILGQTQKYADAMEKAAKLRRASTMSIAERNHFLKD